MWQISYPLAKSHKLAVFEAKTSLQKTALAAKVANFFSNDVSFILTIPPQHQHHLQPSLCLCLFTGITRLHFIGSTEQEPSIYLKTNEPGQLLATCLLSVIVSMRNRKMDEFFPKSQFQNQPI